MCTWLRSGMARVDEMREVCWVLFELFVGLRCERRFGLCLVVCFGWRLRCVLGYVLRCLLVGF